MLQKKTVLVTGGLGFIGSHIVDAMVENGYRVVVLYHRRFSLSHHHISPYAIYHFKVDITDPADINELLAYYEPEIVIHNAAQANRGESKKYPVDYAKSNYFGSIDLVVAAIAHHCEHFIFASSIAVYGNPVLVPVREDHPLLPEEPYGAYKRDVEAFLHDCHRWHGLRVTIFRYSNVYGPRQDPAARTGVVAVWIDSLLQGKSVTILGGQQMMDIVCVDDVVKANLLTIEQTRDGVAMYNVGSGEGLRLTDLFEKIQQATGVKGKVECTPASRPDFICDIGKIKAELGWEPRTSLTDGLERTVAWFREQTVPLVLQPPNAFLS